MSIQGITKGQPTKMSECKVVVVGDREVGKSALIRRFTTGNFVEVTIENSNNIDTIMSDFISDVHIQIKYSNSTFCWIQNNNI